MAPTLPLAFEPSLAPFVVLAALGFAIGVVGHVVRSTWLVVLGILLVFTATVILPLALFGNPY